MAASESADATPPLHEEAGSSLCPNDAQLLAKLDEANRKLEADEKSLRSLSASGQSGQSHSRKGSGSSILSNASANSHVSNLANDEDSAQLTESLWETWGRVVNEWDTVKKKTGYVRELVRKGVPHHFRSLVWQLLCDVDNSSAKGLYVEYLKKTSPSEKQIKRDIARTFPDHDFFKDKDGLGQESLFNVMKAYSLHDREVGYCQGSGFIVGLLLMQMPEEEAFAVLVKLMQDYRLRELFKPSMAELGLCMYQLECLVQELLPDLHMHFQSQGFHTSIYASSWVSHFFTTALPLSAACRVMDLFISEGMEIIFRIGIALLESSQEDLLSLDMEGMVRHFQRHVPIQYEEEIEAEQLFQAAYQVKYNAKKLRKLEKEYTALKSKENEDQIELRRLRTENRLLRQRIDNLEKESASLADRLIQYQVTRAQEAEEMFILKNELASTKQLLRDNDYKLQQANDQIQNFDLQRERDAVRMNNMIQQLQEELADVRIREADANSTVKELNTKINDLEDTNRQLQRAPNNDVEQLQEELIAAKLREAEATLSLKELKQRVHELDSLWEKFIMERSITPTCMSPKDKSKPDVKTLQEELMSVRLREAESLSELKTMKNKVMELETQNQICTNQIRRMDDDNKTSKERLEKSEEREKELKVKVKELERKTSDMESKKKEESMMSRIKEAEDKQMIAELKHKIAELEIQKEELLTAGQLLAKGSNQDLENQIFDLQDEVLALKSWSKVPMDPSRIPSMYNSVAEEDWEADLASTENLNRTLSEIIEGTGSKVADKAHFNGNLTNGKADSVCHSLDTQSASSNGENCNLDVISEDEASPRVNGSSASVT
ncbi:LOW QUALITY PROTEIN: ecotropic viral integration site 5 ortholog-like [Liolophura sinensis]|uniref:LOW QUALITY PROTEIN: ecotropic viral integration site 5 ortholog-like n=1 Tax=Liolophura sinensis TaxID=3198878 RepID=UPI003158B3BD